MGPAVLAIIYPPLVQQPNPSPIIIYLPTGPILKDAHPVDDAQIITALSAASNATIVRVNYRLGNGVRFPTPIHDALAGYDWVRQNLSAKLTPNGQASGTSPKIGVCGQLLGGTLAASLGLTESRLGENGVSAVALNSPIVDWIFPEDPELSNKNEVDDESGDLVEDEPVSWTPMKKMMKKPKKKLSWELYGNNPALPTSALITARHAFFRKPANYFDTFASPILFFRSPGADVPTPIVNGSDADDSSSLDQVPTIRRKVHRVFPPTGSALRLPEMRISTGSGSPLFDQNEEMVRLLRRSVLRKHTASRKFDQFEDDLEEAQKELVEMALAEAEKKVEFHVPANTGLWGLPGDLTWRNEVNEVGAWFRRVLS
ncbi:alpha/beta-hydrolase [Tothia fuscella]|uniref:Alpha/beta-hydrolase n=1 Tax=Tothia fuscella TaxID=1048955 RepID=A0A9P4NHD2_9PEZI|nr:alpha/beta-hydrolase [Tothia fuscella]